MLVVHQVTNFAQSNISFTVQQGETLAVLGRSGVGKTTLLRCIAGLEPYTGEITFDGPLGYAEQTVTLLPHYTVFDNVALPLRLKKVSKQDIDEQVYDTLVKCQIDHLAKRRPGNLSGGEQQRVQLARALVIKPQLLLLDEPFRSLDAYTRDELMAWLKPLLTNQDITTVLVTHDQREADFLATRQLVL